MSDEAEDRGGWYRRRLVRAAAASCAIHMLLFGGLSVSRLELALDQPDSPEAREPKKPKRPAADFRLQVSRSAEAEKPAHERPLEIPVAPPATPPAEPRERPTERTVADRPQQPAEERPVVPPAPEPVEPARARDTAAAPPAERQSPSRQAEVAPAEAAATAAAAEPARAVADAAAEAAPAPLAGRTRPEPARVAARWRPREVALLERLTTRPPDATALAGRDVAAAATAGSPESSAVPRRSTADARSTSDLRAESIAAPAAEAPAAAPAVAPTERAIARRESSAAATARTAANTPAAGGIPRIETGSPAPLATPARSPREAGMAGGSPAAAAGPATPARRQTALAGGTGSTQVELPAASAAVTPAAGTGTAAAAPAAAALASAGSVRSGSRGSAVASGRSAGGASAGETEPAAVGSSLAAGDAIAAAGTLRGSRSAGETAAGGDAAAAQPRRPLSRASGGGAAATGNVGTVAAIAPAAGGAAVGVGGAAAGGGTSPAAGGPGSGAGNAASAAGTAAAGAGGAPSSAAGSATSAAGGGAGDRVERLAPAAVARDRRGTAGRAAITATRAADGAPGQAEAGIEEGLSVSPADIAALGSPGRIRAGLPDQVSGPRSPERIAAAALPSDGRVRDVAQAFAGRRPAAGRAAGGIEDPATLDRARRMVDAGLDFLARSQLADGRWRLTEFAGVTPADVPRLDSDTAATGLALLAFFGAGHDHFDGRHRDTVRRGLEFLVSVQRPDGDLFLPADELSNSCGWLYSHGIAALAVCEAVGMTGDPLVKPAAEKACRFIAASRHPTLGGWRYTPRSDADLSVSGWMLVALRAGELGGVPTDPAPLDGVRTLLAASAVPGDPARYAYNARKADQRRTDLSVACMTAIGTLMRLHTGAAADDPAIVAAGRVLAGIEPTYGTAAQNRRDAYLWYYASQALVHTGGPDWQRWYGSLVATLEPEQRSQGPLGGSWDATGAIPDRWGVYAGRVYVTALHLLALEVPWRHLPP